MPWLTGSTGGGGADLLARTAYNPVALTGFTTSSTTFTNVDGTNLTVTFEAPDSGVVRVRLEALLVGISGRYMSWNLRSGGADIAGTKLRAGGDLGGWQARVGATCRVASLTPGASYTYAWGFAHRGAAITMYCGQGDDIGPAIMEVFAA